MLKSFFTWFHRLLIKNKPLPETKCPKCNGIFLNITDCFYLDWPHNRYIISYRCKNKECKHYFDTDDLKKLKKEE